MFVDVAVPWAETPWLVGSTWLLVRKPGPHASSWICCSQRSPTSWPRVSGPGSQCSVPRWYQSGLRLDRQLETGSTGCQTLRGGGGATAKHVPFLPPKSAGFQETAGRGEGYCTSWAKTYRSRALLATGDFSVLPIRISLQPCQVMAMMAHPPGAPRAGPCPSQRIFFYEPARWSRVHSQSVPVVCVPF